MGEKLKDIWEFSQKNGYTMGCADVSGEVAQLR